MVDLQLEVDYFNMVSEVHCDQDSELVLFCEWIIHCTKVDILTADN